MSLSDMLTTAMPKLLAMPKAKQAAIGDALERMVDAKRQELAASRMLIRALQADYTWWEVSLGNVPQRRVWADYGRTVKVAGCGNLDAAHRARRQTGLQYIYRVTPAEETTDG